MLNFLANLSSGYTFVLKSIPSIELNWIGKIIKMLIEGIGIVGVGIIVFTLILKTIVLPLDIYSRVKMKKQALIMDKMRPQMEKLQKQYANDKNLYSQKVMELQKKNGYSVFGACLPTIVSLVIFIVVFNAFSAYSQYANLESYNNMVKAYNNVVSEYVVGEGNTNENAFIVVDNGEYKVDYDRFTNCYNNVNSTSYTTGEVFVNLAQKYNLDSTIIMNESSSGEQSRFIAIDKFLSVYAAKAAAEYYKENDNSFLWVRNIWYPDSMANKEIPNFDKFKSSIQKAAIDSKYKTSYETVTSQLTQQKNTYNGYFVLIVLSIGFMLVQQWISMKANKSVNELGTVDGQGAKTNKYMMIMMPIMYGIFSFFYSASFSIYMITSTVFSIVTTLIINKALDVSFAKHEIAEERARLTKKGERSGK